MIRTQEQEICIKLSLVSYHFPGKMIIVVIIVKYMGEVFLLQAASEIFSDNKKVFRTEAREVLIFC